MDGEPGELRSGPWGPKESDTTESQAQGSLVGCHLWGRTELDTTEVT